MATPDDNLATLLEIVADVAADSPAVAHRDTIHSWTEFEDRASRLARHLSDSGVGRGARVGIALYNGPEYLEAVFALMKLRAVPVNVNYRYRERELLEILGDASATGLIFDSALDDRLIGVARELPGLTVLLRLASPGPDGEAAPPAGEGWGDLKPGDYATSVAAAEPMPRVPRGGDDEWVLFTGGTTGRPKGVRASHRWLIGVAENNGPKLLGRDVPADIAGMAEFARRTMSHPRRPISLVAPPLIHGPGRSCALGTLLCGGTVVLLPGRSYRPEDVMDVVARHRVTDMCLVGDAFARPLADALEAAAAQGRPADLSSLRRILSVGVAWSAEVKHRLLEHCDAVLQDSVAASEGGPFAISYTKRGDRAISSRFELFPGARVITEDGEDVVPGSGQVGYLAAPAPEEIGYLGDPVKSAETFRQVRGQRYSVPGDMAILEADGSLILLGRDSRVINTGGEKVFAEEVEQVICAHPDVQDANVVGLPDERWGQRIGAVVALRPGAELTAEQVREHVGTELADYKRPRQVVFVPAIQRTLTGKSDLAWARKTAAGQE